MKNKQLTVGYKSFKELIENNRYYVDKTLLIKELVERGEKCTLFTRPRRFGKTLNQMMLKAFFDRRENNRHLFNDLAINDHKEVMNQHCNQYPVIFLSFNAVDSLDFEAFKSRFKHIISTIYNEYSFIKDSLGIYDQKFFNEVVSKNLIWEEYIFTLSKLSDFLSIHYKSKVVILIDEYDVPISKGFYQNYYEEVVDFFRGLFINGLKENVNLQLAVLTGCLRVSKESIFTGLNNISVYSLLASDYDEYFGFTQKEVDEMARYYDLEDKLDKIKAWYDGYRFGDVDIYNPWSICKFISGKSKLFIPYWANTASNTEIKDLIVKSDNQFRNDINILLRGGLVEKVLLEDISYQSMYTNPNMIYSFLVFAGYLKAIRMDKFENNRIIYQLQLPNTEIETIFTDLINSLLNEFIGTNILNAFINSILDGDVDSFEDELINAIQRTSYHDMYDENSYHMYLLGLLFSKDENYITVSNREAGLGRYDICVKEKLAKSNSKRRAVILELKKVRRSQTLEQSCEEALKQAISKKYKTDLIQEGYEDIKIYGVAFKGKECKVMLEQ